MSQSAQSSHPEFTEPNRLSCSVASVAGLRVLCDSCVGLIQVCPYRSGSFLFATISKPQTSAQETKPRTIRARSRPFRFLRSLPGLGLNSCVSSGWFVQRFRGATRSKNRFRSAVQCFGDSFGCGPDPRCEKSGLVVGGQPPCSSAAHDRASETSPTSATAPPEQCISDLVNCSRW